MLVHFGILTKTDTKSFGVTGQITLHVNFKLKSGARMRHLTSRASPSLPRHQFDEDALCWSLDEVDVFLDGHLGLGAPLHSVVLHEPNQSDFELHEGEPHPDAVAGAAAKREPGHRVPGALPVRKEPGNTEKI